MSLLTLYTKFCYVKKLSLYNGVFRKNANKNALPHSVVLQQLNKVLNFFSTPHFLPKQFNLKLLLRLFQVVSNILFSVYIEARVFAHNALMMI